MLNISFALSFHSIGRSTFPVHTYILTPPPHAHRAHAQSGCQQETEADAEHNHGSTGHAHGEFYIIGSPQHIGQAEEGRPDKDGASVMDQHQDASQPQPQDKAGGHPRYQGCKGRAGIIDRQERIGYG